MNFINIILAKLNKITFSTANSGLLLAFANNNLSEANNEPKKAKASPAKKKDSKSKKQTPKKPSNKKTPKNKKPNKTAAKKTDTTMAESGKDTVKPSQASQAPGISEQLKDNNKAQSAGKASHYVKLKIAILKDKLATALKAAEAEPKKYAIAAGITLAPILSMALIYANPMAGAYLNAATLTALAIVAVKYQPLRNLAISVAILPIINLYNLAVPQQDLLLRTVIIYSLLLVLTLTYRYLLTLDSPKKKISLGSIIAIQLVLIAALVIGQWQYSAISNYYPFGVDSIALTVFIFIIFVIVEEMYFRGLVQENAIKELGVVPSVIIAGLLFGFIFIGPNMPWAIVFGLLGGFIISTVYAWRQNIILSITANMASKLLLIGLLTVL